MTLTDMQCRKAQKGERDYKLADSLGLYLFVTTKGFRSWRMKYRFAGKEKRLTFGPYPEVSLSEAREQRDAARRLLRDHKDPAVARAKSRASSIENAEQTFEIVARRWHAAQTARWSTSHAETVIESLERDIFEAFGSMPLVEVDTPLILATLRKVEKRGAVETAHRLRQRISAVFVQAISEGIASADPAAVVTKALKPMPKSRKQPALIQLDQARAIMAAVDGSTADAITKLASRLLALTAVRPVIIRGAVWSEIEGIDWDDERYGPDLPIWRIPAARMKLDKDRKEEEAFEHIVPLSRQAVDTLRAARRLSGRHELIFPSVRMARRPMSENAIGYLYNRVGFYGRHVPHGWRSTFSTILNERAEREKRPSDQGVIDLMLAHIPKGVSASEGAYNRAAFMPRRRELAQIWADMLAAGLAPADEVMIARR